MKFNKSILGLRGVAAISVFIFHIVAGAKKADFLPEQLPDFIVSCFLALNSGVEIFFMISGYLISGSIIRHGNIKNFLIDRAIRIYTPFVPVLVPIFLFGPFLNYDYFDEVGFIEWLGLFAANLLFLPGIFPMEAALIVAWTLSYEAAFYLYTCVIFAAGRKINRSIFIAGAILVSAFLMFMFPQTVFFAVGAGAFAFQNSVLRAAQTTEYFTFPSLVAMLYGLFILGSHAHQDFSGLLAVIGLWFFAATAGAIFFTSVAAEKGLFSRFLRHPVTQWLGTVSYSLYLWHTFVMFVTKRFAVKYALADYGSWPAFLLFGITSLVITMPLSWVSYIVFERWLAKKIHTYISFRKQYGSIVQD